MTTRQINRETGPRTYEVTTIDGTVHEYPSVTSILGVINKPALVGWSAKVTAEGYTSLLQANEVGDFGPMMMIERAKLPEYEKLAKGAGRSALKTAGDIGTRVHHWIECENTDQPLPDVTEDMVSSLDAYQVWKKEAGITVMVAEQVVYSHEYRFAGTLDALGVTHDGKRVLLDYKTSNGIYDETALQLAAYAFAEHEMSGGDLIEEAWCLRLPKDGQGFEARMVSNPMNVFFDAFMPALKLHAAMNKNKAHLWAPKEEK
jgi:hypothetical protein